MDAKGDHRYNPEGTDKGKSEEETTVTDVCSHESITLMILVSADGVVKIKRPLCIAGGVVKIKRPLCIGKKSLSEITMWQYRWSFEEFARTYSELRKNYRKSPQTTNKADTYFMSLLRAVKGENGLKGIANTSLGKGKGDKEQEHNGENISWIKSLSDKSHDSKVRSGSKGIYNTSSTGKGDKEQEHNGENNSWVKSLSDKSYDSKGGRGLKGIDKTSSTGKGDKDLEDNREITSWVKSLSAKSYDSKEFRELEDMIKCKVCLDADLNILFLPCRHMATCQNCSSVLQRCPICRSTIETSIELN